MGNIKTGYMQILVCVYPVLLVMVGFTMEFPFRRRTNR